MVLTVVLEDEHGTWYLRVHPTRSWDLSLQPIDCLKRIVCSGSIENDGSVSGNTPQEEFPKVDLDRLKSILETLCD